MTHLVKRRRGGDLADRSGGPRSWAGARASWALLICTAWLAAASPADSLPIASEPAGSAQGVPMGDGRWVDAAVTTAGATYMFQGPSYLRFHAARLDPGYPRLLSGGGWQGLPPAFRDGIDAAVYAADVGKTYFFRGTQYLRLTGVVVDPGYPLALPGGWEGLPPEFQQGIDAAVFHAGHVFFFKGGRYVRFTGARLDPGYPADLPGGWELPAAFRPVDAALSVGDKNYFFSGGEYVRLTGTRVDPGYPRPLPGGWAGLPGPGSGASVPPGTAAGPTPPGRPPVETACTNPATTTTLQVVVSRATDVAPIAGAKVEVYGPGGVHETATTGGDGSASFELAVPGPHQVLVAGLGVARSVTRTVEVFASCINTTYVDSGETCEEIKAAADVDCLPPEMQAVNEECNQTYLAERAACTGDAECGQAVKQAYDFCIDNLTAEKAACVDDRLKTAGCRP